ncbi:MAG: signal recognition particle receptor subunit alpha [Candidatus Aenigmatarchaeota archaeon]
MLKQLSDKLKQAMDKISKLVSVDKEAVEELVKEMQRALISADVDVDLVFELSESIRKRAFESLPSGMTRKEHIIKVVYDELVKILGEEKSRIDVRPKRILLVGLYGSGKTTTAAKLALYYKKKGLRCCMIACDTARPAAFEQLEQLSEQVNVQFYGEGGEKNSVKILKDALRNIKADVIIADSSGRNALDRDLINEIKDLSKTMNPDEKILVMPAEIGQAASEQAAAFSEIGITDVIVTRMDATAKGGGALTACYETGAKVKFITTGEKPDALEEYDPKKFVARLLGFPDLETLLEKAKENVDEKRAEKMLGGDFTIEDFYSQIEGMQSMGGFSKILDMMGMSKLGTKVPGGLELQEDKVKKWKYAIQSMTIAEKNEPEIMDTSRIRRIAKGSGLSEQYVRELIANYSKTKKMMKQISPSKLKRSGMFRQFGMRF